MPDQERPPARRTIKTAVRTAAPTSVGEAAALPFPELEHSRLAYLAQVEAEGRALVERARAEIDTLRHSLPTWPANGRSPAERSLPLAEVPIPTGDAALVLARVVASLVQENSQLRLQVETLLTTPRAGPLYPVSDRFDWWSRSPLGGPAATSAPAGESGQTDPRARSSDEVMAGLDQGSGQPGAGPTASAETAPAVGPGVASRGQEATLASERQRLAHEIHDGLTQQLTAVVLELEAALKALPSDPEAARQRIAGATASSREALGEIRRLIGRLRAEAPRLGGLSARLTQLAEALARETELTVHIDAGPELALDDPRREEELVHIAQEIFTNVRKHSQARGVTVALSRQEQELELIVQDDGRGFLVREVTSLAAGAGKFGILGLHERAQALGGGLTIASTPGRGTRVIVRVPVGAGSR